ncbi:MAG: rhomboid family intramembrane serine protease [Candidatus Nanohaloarchaea archaeon]
MGKCSACGKEDLTFTCNYCGDTFCAEHQLPENHDCSNIDEAKSPVSKNSSGSRRNRETPERRYRRPSLGEELKSALVQNYTVGIILFTVAVFSVQAFLGESPTSNVFYQLFVLQPGLGEVLAQPWTLITVMFLHGGTFHLFANMITLYFFGTPVERITGGKEFLKFYFSAGLFASLGYVAFRNLLAISQGSGVLEPAVGASGAVVAMFAAVSVLYPEAEILLYFVIPMKIRTGLYLFAAMEGFNMVAKSLGVYLPVIGNFASSAHIAGMVFGVYYGRKLRERHRTGSGVLDLLGY